MQWSMPQGGEEITQMTLTFIIQGHPEESTPFLAFLQKSPLLNAVYIHQ